MNACSGMYNLVGNLKRPGIGNIVECLFLKLESSMYNQAEGPGSGN